MDEAWWRHYLDEVKDTFTGERVSHGVRRDVQRIRAPYFRQAGQNSGAGAIALAHHFGARVVYLLGYDCQRTGGKAHWHGDHPEIADPKRRMGNAGSLPKWPSQFRELVRFVPGLEIINCSRETALTVFPRASLESVLT